MQFRTPLPALSPHFCITHGDPTLWVGSCFTEHIGGRMAALKFPTRINPQGILFQPEAIARCLKRLATPEALFAEADFFEWQGLWRNWELHSRLAHPRLDEAVRRANEAYRDAASFLLRANTLALTLGTAWVYCLRDSGLSVANNHKAPPDRFERRRLDPSQIVDALGPVVRMLQDQRPGLRVILSVSPVKHLREGLRDNLLSKSSLLLACETLCRQLPDAVYFPAYEILTEELRDYRFFSADMAHPSEQAVEYIWQFFRSAFFDEKTESLAQRIERLRVAVAHRPHHPESAAFHDFLQKTAHELAALEAERPEWDWSEERALMSGGREA
ncbi:MAG: GSCFA domain-containing protein [Saprospiraceae bacterium]